ncbi:histidine phosphatase family protein [Fructilactobacillus vespulae]|uniref:histidine phosphatase family protein n=1 Tax=Fructilactobacillus vespulae TaxID=1249630 RepID=UPI0039B413A2
MTQINLYFVRHGQTQLNSYKRIQGWADSDLTEKGVKDAENAADLLSQLKFDAAYSSDTKRASRTARIILKQNPADLFEPIQRKALREENFGYFEGNDTNQVWNMIGGPHGVNTYSDMIKKFSMEKTRDMIAAADPYHDAEDNEAFWNRVQPGIDAVAQAAKDGDNVLVVAHGSMIRSIVSKFSDIDISEPILNGSVTKLVFDGHDYHAKFYNHVTDLNE